MKHEVFARIRKDPGMRFGKPCIRGTRIAVIDVLGWLATGMSRRDILEDYDFLTDEDITAALEYAQSLAEADQLPLSAE